jgi:probable rRNA maturation factor
MSPDLELIKEAVLGKNFELSLVFCSAKKIQSLNKIYRNINKPTDILSFPLSKNSGEIFICKSEARKMMAEFDRPYENFLAFLFIHGLVHLKGYDHGAKMEKIEQKFRQKFGV